MRQLLEVCNESIGKEKIVITSFTNTRTSLLVDGSQDHVIKIIDFRPKELIIADWARSEQETRHRTSESENTELCDLDPLSMEY